MGVMEEACSEAARFVFSNRPSEGSPGKVEQKPWEVVILSPSAGGRRICFGCSEAFTRFFVVRHSDWRTSQIDTLAKSFDR